MKIDKHTNVAHGQWRGPWFFIHVGSTCWTFGDRGVDYYAPGIEVMTRNHWFRVRRGSKRRTS